MHVKNIHWIVIEDGYHTVDAVERVLKRSRIAYVYFHKRTEPGFPEKGWTQRNIALTYIRNHYGDYKGEGVVYFADDDNSYDLRLFDSYIRKVKDIGIWGVGLGGSTAYIEAPRVVNGKIARWDVMYLPDREFAIDMAGFAVNLKLVLNSNASFNKQCIEETPETCYLSQYGLKKEEVTPFGWNDNPKDVLVWHTRAERVEREGGKYNYIIEG